MVSLLDRDKVEEIVGIKRHPKNHHLRADSIRETTYLLHSQECLDTRDLWTCNYAIAQDKGIDLDYWDLFQDQPVLVRIDTDTGKLLPGTVASLLGRIDWTKDNGKA